jgi:uncharacterized protein YpbB
MFRTPLDEATIVMQKAIKKHGSMHGWIKSMQEQNPGSVKTRFISYEEVHQTLQQLR